MPEKGLRGGIKAGTKQWEGSLDWVLKLKSWLDKETFGQVTGGGMLRKVPPLLINLFIFVIITFCLSIRMLNFFGLSFCLILY